jgi:hypothetical protein
MHGKMSCFNIAYEVIKELKNVSGGIRIYKKNKYIISFFVI